MRKNLLFFVLSVLALLLTGCVNKTQQNLNDSQANASSAYEIAKAEKIEVVDFHGTRRCYSCQTIEKYTRATLEEYFHDELNNGTITFQSVNGELPENQALVIKYQARGSSLFVNAIRDGKDIIEEDTTVWRLVGDEQKFKSYFKEKIKILLN